MYPDPSAADEPIPIYTDLTSLYASLGHSLSHACVPPP